MLFLKKIDCLINQIVDKLVQKYGTSDPYQLCDYLNIFVRYAPTDDEFDGLYAYLNSKQLIILNEKYKDNEEGKFILAHELFHAIHHSDIIAYYHTGVNVKGKKEREADEFATKLLLYEADLTKHSKCEFLLKENYIPYEMERYV